MTIRFSHLTWVLMALAVSWAGLPLLTDEGTGLNLQVIAPVLVALVWLVTVLLLLPAPWVDRVRALPRALRRRPFLWWWLILLAIVGGVGWWGLLKHTFERENFYLWLYLWLSAFLFAAGLDSDSLRSLGNRFAHSRWTSAMMTLTTLVLLLAGIEIGMRMFLIMSDNYGFSIMNARWFNTYWYPINEIGYRDYPIADDVADDVQRVLVVGDSFAAGHGINSIDDTFPHILDRELGDGYTVNVAARPGWNTDRELAALEAYPLEPDLVVLSYYLNDIIHLNVDEYEEGIKSIYPLLPEPIWTFVANFYLPNFLYWHIYRQFATGGNTLYNDLILEPYADPDMWQQQADFLSQFIDYADDHDADLLVLVWPSLNALSVSEQPTATVTSYFQGQDIPVINLSDDLRGRSPGELVVNPFDAHPNVAIHTLAADRLADAIRDMRD